MCVIFVHTPNIDKNLMIDMVIDMMIDMIIDSSAVCWLIVLIANISYCIFLCHQSSISGELRNRDVL